MPERLETAKAALLASDVNVKAWRNAVNSTTCTVFDAVDALKLVHDVVHLREVQAMSQTGGGFDTDTYCAPGSWEAVLDGTRAWADAVALAVDDEGHLLMANVLRRVVVHHLNLKQRVADVRFSPDGKWVAFAIGRLVQVMWK